MKWSQYFSILTMCIVGPRMSTTWAVGVAIITLTCMYIAQWRGE